jgi:hypothetical protein
MLTVSGGSWNPKRAEVPGVWRTGSTGLAKIDEAVNATAHNESAVVSRC